LGLQAVQLHGDPRAADVQAMRAAWHGEVWAVLRVAGAELPAHAAELFRAADAVLLDAKVDGALGGTGVALAWDEIAGAVAELRGRGARLVLAGGLRPENVASAVRALLPDVVDVSSGIESTVGIKDAGRMRAFRDAVRSAGAAR
ncbi:MAG: phosphoribosylanthranilate isomerase, partial [Gemmatimonadaceae bacterium]